uniref:LNR domain-containing protein n=1 Tax=Strigamia maritima TaxID=126957 RepID=T1J0Y8_STRMM
MKQLTLLLISASIVLSQQHDILFNLHQTISSANCTSLQNLESKLQRSPLIQNVQLISSHHVTILLHIIQSKIENLQCKEKRNLHKRSTSECQSESIGDGWCDLACNVLEKEWDGGDCCPHTCAAKARPFPCGSGGYQCKGAKKIPVWFAARTRLCYNWYADGDGGQCGDGVGSHLCANVGELTTPYRDDTDGRPGGCRMSWGLETTDLSVPEWFKQTSICYRWFADGDGGQCGAGAPAESCAPLGSFTAVYRDDTDGRPGGCQMSWRISIPQNADYWASDIALCYQWYPDGDGGQCGGGADRRLCAVANSWTPYYRDDSDGRGGGCRMQWGLILV